LVVGSLLAAASTDVRAMRGGVWERAAVADLPDVGREGWRTGRYDPYRIAP